VTRATPPAEGGLSLSKANIQPFDRCLGRGL